MNETVEWKLSAAMENVGECLVARALYRSDALMPHTIVFQPFYYIFFISS